MNSTYWCIRPSKTRPLDSGNILNMPCHAKFSLIFTWNIQGLFWQKYFAMLWSVCRIHPLDLILSLVRKITKTKNPIKEVVDMIWNIRDECLHFYHFQENSPLCKECTGSYLKKNEALTQIFSSSHLLL